MKTSIIIPYYHSPEHLLRCLASLQTCALAADFEVIVMDDASPTPVSREIRNRFPTVIFHRNRKNCGFVCSANQGAAKARGDILVFLNADTEMITPGWLQTLEKTFYQEKKLGMVGAKMLFPDSKLVQFAGGGINRELGHSEHLYYLAPPFIPPLNRKREVEMISGACLAIPRHLFSRIGGFSTDFHSMFEDTDLGFRVRQAGQRLLYLPEIVLYHCQDVTGITTVNYFSSKMVLQRKWKNLLLRPQHHYYEDDGFSEIFVRRLLRLFDRDFRYVWALISAFDLNTPKKQELFSAKHSAPDILQLCLKHFPATDRQAISDLHFYLFRLYLQTGNSAKVWAHARNCLHNTGPGSKQDEIRIAKQIAGSKERLNNEIFFKPQWYQLYRMLIQIQDGSFALDSVLSLSAKSLLIKILQMINRLHRILPKKQLAYYGSLILEHSGLFANEEDVISFLFNMALLDTSGMSELYFAQARGMVQARQWYPMLQAKFTINMGSYLEKRGEWLQAGAHFRKAEHYLSDENGPLLPSLCYHLGMNFYHSGQRERARVYFQRFIKMNPANQELVRWLRQEFHLNHENH